MSDINTKLAFMSNLILNIIGVSIDSDNIVINEEHKLVKANIKPGIHIEFEYTYDIMELDFFGIIGKGDEYKSKPLYQGYRLSIEDIIDDKTNIMKVLSKLNIS